MQKQKIIVLITLFCIWNGVEKKMYNYVRKKRRSHMNSIATVAYNVWLAIFYYC